MGKVIVSDHIPKVKVRHIQSCTFSLLHAKNKATVSPRTSLQAKSALFCNFGALA